METDKVCVLYILILSTACLLASVWRRIINVQNLLEQLNLAEEIKPNQACPCTNIFIWFHIIYKLDSCFLENSLLSCTISCSLEMHIMINANKRN